MTHKLLQVLSHPVKLEILKVITKEPEPVENIAKKLEISVEETTVHLDRLHEAGLVDRESEGIYHAGPFGQLILSLLRDLDFVAANSEHFRDLDLSLLPITFVERLGDLKESKRMEGTVSNLEYTERLFGEAEKNISVIANEVMLDAVPIVREKISKGADFRFIIDQTFKPPSDFKPEVPELWRQVWKIPAAIAVTDKEAMVFFLDRKLKVDYSVGFVSTEESFMKWCEDLINHLWAQGQKVE
jgi:predicted transcriptional regulator